MIHLVAFIGPSGSGKTTIAKSLGIPAFITLTTREPRQGEIQGEDYNFITKEDFLNRRKMGLLIEDIEYHGNYYGTDIRDLRRVLYSGKPHYVIVTYDGYEQLKKYVTEGSIISIFVFALKEEIEERMRRRGDSEDIIKQRLSSYENELKYINKCNWVVGCFDGELDRTVDCVKNLIGLYK